jgi:glycosyltransferase involved in cell wall biosynthesis
MVHGMRIALVCRKYYPEIGGVETHVKEIAERLAKDNDVTVFTLASDNKMNSEIINGVTIRRFKSLRLSYSIEIPPLSMIRELQDFDPQIIHAHNIHTVIPYYALKVNCNAKFIFTPHYQGNALTLFRRILFRFYKPLLKKVLAKADRVVCLSVVEKDMLVNMSKVSEEKIVIIPNGVDPQIMEIVPRRGDLRILSVARFDLQHKKTHKLIQAFKIIQPKIQGKLVLVGSGPDKEAIIRMIDDFNLRDKVELKTNLSKAELFEEYSKASIFVMASENEAFSIAVTEALAAKMLVILPKSTGQSYFINAGYAVGIDPPITPDKIAEVIISCITNKPRTTEYAPYTWDIVVEELCNLYGNLLN